MFDRASVTSELVLEGVRLPYDAVLPEVRGLKGPLSCLTEARFGIVWGALGAVRDCFDTALAYATTREQFGRPIAGFQLTQAKFADMALCAGFSLALQIGQTLFKFAADLNARTSGPLVMRLATNPPLIGAFAWYGLTALFWPAELFGVDVCVA